MSKKHNPEDLNRYQAALKKIGHKNLLEIPEPFKTQLTECTDLHEKSLLLERIANYY